MVFFCLSLVAACGRGEVVTIQQVVYEDNKPVGVRFSTDMDVEDLRVFVGEESQTSVIGLIVSVKDYHQFTPVISFTPGQTYTLRKSDTLVLASFTIPKRASNKASELLAIHPKVDTVPENLLKMYLEFAQPMQDVHHALDFITVTNETDGTETAPFLRLESELWNKERTVLTLWLDPGRIKTDLIPNRERGLPLTAGKTYTLQIDSLWKSREGMPLERKYTKRFHVRSRDDKRPNATEWQLRMEEEGSMQPLRLNFGEPMDAFLARETIQIFDLEGKPIRGRFTLGENASVLRFEPSVAWSGRDIELRIESRIEDLAGNNLNRLFDRPITEETRTAADTLEIRSLRFSF